MNTEIILREEVESLVDEVKKTHRYSMSRIYGLYNKVFDKNETPQSCASCLIRKVRELTAWLDSAKVVEEKEPKKRRAKKTLKKE